MTDILVYISKILILGELHQQVSRNDHRAQLKYGFYCNSLIFLTLIMNFAYYSRQWDKPTVRQSLAYINGQWNKPGVYPPPPR